MSITQLSPKLWIMAQPDLSAIATLPQQGFAALINNRPDGEEPGQAGSAAEAAAARAAGLSYAHIPVQGLLLTEQDAARFRQEVEAAPGPVVAHCRSGTRSFLLWVMGGDLGGSSNAEILSRADKAGVKRDLVAPRLAARRAAAAGGR